MANVVLLIIFFCLFVGLLYPCLALLGYDVYSRKSKTLNTIIRWRRRGVDLWKLRPFNAILKIVAPIIPIGNAYEKKMATDLNRADIPYTPQEYIAKAILSGMPGLLLVAFAASMKSWILVLGGLLLSVYLFFHNYDQVKDILKDKTAILENEIPTFVRSVESGLHSDKDIIRVIERYNKIASVAMKSELEVLLADMKSSSIPKALLRFDSRMNSPEISRLVAALIEVERGTDATLTLQYLAQDMTVMHRQVIQRELDKRPGKMKRAILPAGIVLVIMMLYILIEAVIQSASTLL